MTDLKSWLKAQPPEVQDVFFRQAARFFSNRELAAIIGNVKTGCSLYQAHLRTGVLDRYSVDLTNIRWSMS